MSAPLDNSDFIDRDFLADQTARPAATLAPPAPMNPSSPPPSGRPPTREELEQNLTAKHQQLAELKARQDAIERERVALEESRRRQAEFENGRPEVVRQLTRGIELLGKAEFDARREAEQMAKTLAGLREVQARVAALQPDTWTPETWQTELTRGLTTLENARMEWNAARLKWSVLSGESGGAAGATGGSSGGRSAQDPGWPAAGDLRQWCKLGLALTWPVAAVALLGLIVLTVLLLRQ